MADRVRNRDGGQEQFEDLPRYWTFSSPTIWRGPPVDLPARARARKLLKTTMPYVAAAATKAVRYEKMAHLEFAWKVKYDRA